MFSTFLQELRGYLGKGYLLAVFVPTLLFATVHLALALEVYVGLNEAWQNWTALSTDAKLLMLFAGLVGVSLAAYLVHNLQFRLTQLFEGYWPAHAPFPWLQERRRERYLKEWNFLQGRIAQLAAEIEYARAEGGTATHVASITLETQLNEVSDRALTFFPPPSQWKQIRPTQLGNVLRSSEIYAYDHYGIDAVVVWTRLRPLLPASVGDALQDKKIAMDFMVLISTYAGLTAAIWAPYLAITTDRWGLFLVAITGLPIAVVCYQNAVQCALAYAEQIKSVFDLYRHELLAALHLKIPVTPEQERALWKDLSGFFHRNFPPRTAYHQTVVALDEAHKYLQPAPCSDPTGRARVRKALEELRTGVNEWLKSG